MPRLIRKRPRDVIRGRLRDCIISILANNVASVQLRRRYRLEARLAPVPCRGSEGFLRPLFEPLGYEEARGLQTLLMIANKDR